jgi:hypothetical protein
LNSSSASMLGKSDLDAGYCGAAPVVDRSENRAAHSLRGGLRRPQQRNQTDEYRVYGLARKSRTGFARHKYPPLGSHRDRWLMVGKADQKRFTSLHISR